MHASDRGHACLFAATTLLGAQLAVLMPSGMLLAFFGADAACERASLDNCAQHLLV
jgi:hypothetical protein